MDALRAKCLTYVADCNIINSDIVTYEPPNLSHVS